MSSIFGMFMELWILRVSSKVSEAGSAWFHEQTKFEFIAYIYILL